MTLSELIRNKAPLDDITRHLEALDTPALRKEVLRLGRGEQRYLYEVASCDIGLDHFAPANGKGVMHAGRNTLPLPPPFKSFAKVFARAPDKSERLFGFNESPSRPLIGPGYFVAYSTADKPDWKERGGVVVDYFNVPDLDVPKNWPRVVPNSHGLQYFVYRNTRDFMKRLSSKVSVGAAFKVESPLDHYFMLLNEA